MKSCPTCHRQYADGTMKFCLDDGSLLVEELAPTRGGSDADATLHLPIPPAKPTAGGRVPQQSTMTSLGHQSVDGVFSGSQIQSERAAHPTRGLLWVVIALIIGGSGIAIALIVMRGRPQVTALVAPTPTSIASPSSTLNGSPTIESRRPADTGQVNRPTEKATPLIKATPTRVDVKEQPPPPAPRAPISGGVLNGKAVHLVQPPYPAIARSAHASGQVVVQVLIDENGNVVSAHATSGHPLLQAVSVSAARSSKFSPTTISGQPVKVNGVIIYNFVAQ